MAFNILVGNDDDHLRNHAFLFDQRGWRLSPLYDVVPKPRVGSEGRLILKVGDRGHAATLENALTSAAAFGLKPDEAASLLEDLRLQVEAGWQDGLKRAGLSSTDIERLEKCFSEAHNANWRAPPPR
jgi:serine/threonine-protein kinase HipA